MSIGSSFLLGLPPGFSSWSAVPVNPLIGIKGATAERSKDDYTYYCDACQKGFMNEAAYTAHKDDHVYCEVPGCGFTCRRDKMWKMDMHVETLHNRPDAPNLADVSKYLSDRKSKFPTSSASETKAEELMLRASRGELLPDERRRWLRRYGVIVARDGRGVIHQHQFGSDNKNVDASGTDSGSRKREPPSEADLAKAARREARLRRVAIAVAANMEKEALQEQGSSNNVGQRRNQQQQQQNNPQQHQQTQIPMGAHGRMTKSQQVQLVRDRYRAAAKVPTFYVCNRCGVKGQHWIEECPSRPAVTSTNNSSATSASVAVFGPAPATAAESSASSSQIVITEPSSTSGEEKQRENNNIISTSNIVEDDAAGASSDSDLSSISDPESLSSGSSGRSSSDDHDAGDGATGDPSTSISTKNNKSVNKEERPTCPTPSSPAKPSVAVDAAPPPTDDSSDLHSQEKDDLTRPLTHNEEIQRRRLIARRRLRDHPSGGATQAPPTLLDRMMEDSKLASSGLVLQALRFFVATNFLQGQEGEADREEVDEEADGDDDDRSGE